MLFMKTFLKIIGGIIALIIILIIVLHFYFTNARLKEMVMPRLNEALGRQVSVDHLSFSILTTFPQVGLDVEGVAIPADQPKDTLAWLHQLTIKVDLIPLISKKVQIAGISLDQPHFVYHVYKNGHTNLDGLIRAMSDTTAADTGSSSMPLDIRHFELTDGYFGYVNDSTNTAAYLNNVDASAGIHYGKVLDTDLSLSIDGLSFSKDGSHYLKNLPIKLKETSVINMDSEQVRLKQAQLTIQGLNLDLSGSVSQWSETPRVDLSFASGSSDFGALLRLLPPDMQSNISHYETHGSLALNGHVKGAVGGSELPSITAKLGVTDGYFKDPDLQEPIHNIRIRALFTNEKLTVDSLYAQAGSNVIQASGALTNPLGDNGRFSADVNGNVDLGTVSQFYPIGNMSIEALKGKLIMKAHINGKTSDPKATTGSGHLSLTNGYIKYKDLAKPLEDLTLAADISNNTIDVRKGSVKMGDNTVSITGSVRNYLTDDRIVNLSMKTSVHLDEIESLYSLKPLVTKMTGLATATLNVEGPVETPARLRLSGTMNLQNVNIEGDSLPEPIHNLNAKMTLTPSSAKLNTFKMYFGESDISLKGSVEQYMTLLENAPHKQPPASLTGSLTSRHFNFDGLIEWQEKHSNPNDTTPIPINLPYMKSSIDVVIDTLTATGVNITHMKANITTSPTEIRMNRGTFDLFGGKVSGKLVWEVPKPLKTHIIFKGTMDSVQVDQFFREYPVLGRKSRFYQYVKGKFSATVDYAADMLPYLSPDIKSTKANGTFGMRNATLQSHPVQKELAKLLKDPKLTKATLDDWTASYKMDDGVLTLKNVKLTSQDIGVRMDGTENLINDRLNFKMTALLPGRLGNGLGSVIGSQAVKVLRTDKGQIAVPILVRGTSEQPHLAIDKEVVKKMVGESAKNALKNELKKLFGN